MASCSLAEIGFAISCFLAYVEAPAERGILQERVERSLIKLIVSRLN